MNAIRLKTEYLFDPLGIDVQRPRLTWNAEGGVKQRAFEIVTDKWQSGKVESDEMHAVYPLPLTSRERVVWKVRLWDENDEPGDWAQAFFEMGLLTKDDWTAQWITGDYRPNRKERYPVDCFSKTFTLGKPVKSARLYATAYGLYEARLGGKRVGAFVMAPGYTDYTKRIQYQTYDVTKMLREGENELTCQLADGWFRGSCGAWGKKNQYGTETKLLLQLEIAFIDGSRQVIGTDPSWAWSNDGPIRQADNKDGEIVEAFRTPMYTGKARVTKHSVTPTASNNVPVVEKEQFAAKKIITPSGTPVLDFGQNIAGYVSFRVHAKAGQKI
ncbi:MAG: alpha-L-rhamnosidase N-terminal domain-containing protein, partial [Clostridia bacterium]|nr:alpha-L-rhamnosidase N-terminal domain-containing protein [Clostridia bacterium]